MRITVLIALLFIAISSFGQKAPAKFGDIPKGDLEMKVYPLDSSAAAVVLFDYGVAYISATVSTVNLVFERHTRIKILKKEGLRYADVSIPLFHSGSSEEKVNNLKAVTYNLEGGNVVESKLAKEGTFKEEFNRNYNQVKFTLPNVKEGSVIEFSYKVASEFLANFPNWTFQRTIPVRHSEYWAMLPKIFSFEKYMQGYVPITTFEENETSYYGESVNSHHYISKDVPAFKEEPYMTSESDYLSRINYALSHYTVSGVVYEIMGSWDKLASSLRDRDSFGRAIKGSGFLKDEVEKITAGITDPAAKIAALTNYVKTNFEWDGFKDYDCYPLKKIFEKKKGTSGDLNLLLASMLNKADLDVEMVLLSTRDHGFIRASYPMERQFNYVISSVKVGDKIFLLDATEKYLPFDVIPSRCLNGQGLRITSSGYNWIEIGSKAKDKTYTSADFALSADGILDGKINFQSDGYNAMKVRDKYFSKGEESFAKDFLSDKQWTVVKKEFKDMKELDKSAKAFYEININEHASAAGNLIYINPFVINRTEENPFKSEKRQYPVDYGSKMESVYSCKITIPSGYSVDELPKSKVIMLPDNGGRYIYNAAQMENAINITSNFQINKTLFTQTEYPILREFYNQVVAKQAEQIVLKKK